MWHIMKIYSHFGINDFVICCGYKGYLIKEYFANYFLHMSDVTFDMQNNSVHVHEKRAEPWRVTLVDTGEKTQTGGRLRRVAAHLVATAEARLANRLDTAESNGELTAIAASIAAGERPLAGAIDELLAPKQ